MKRGFNYLVLFLAVLNAGVILYFWFQGSYWHLTQPWAGSRFIVLGRLFGLFGQYLILVELILVGRIMPLERIIGYEKLNRWHRFIGLWILIILISHPLLLAYGYNNGSFSGIQGQLISFVVNWEDVFKAVIGILIICFAILISYRPLRRRLPYEVWYITHLIIYLAITLIFGHQLKSGDMATGKALYYWMVLNLFVFGIMLAYRFGRPLALNYRQAFKVWKIEQETADVLSIYIRGRHLEKFTFEPGQYAYLNTHPFSFSSAPNGKYLRFSIKQLGDFTKRLTKIKAGDKVYLDGPHGVFTTSRAKKEKFLFIAGGIGITPIRAMYEDCAQRGRDAVLLYSCRDHKSTTLLRELNRLSEETKGLCRIHTILDDKNDTNAQEHGRVDEERIRRLVPDFLERDFYICGPKPMILTLNKLLISMGANRKQIHYELFSF